MKKLLSKPHRLTVKIAKKITKFDQVFVENEQLKQRNKELENIYNFGWPNGHYYSPVHSLEDLKDFKLVQKRATEKFASAIPSFSDKKMVKEFNGIKPYFKDFDYPKDEKKDCRFYSNNISLSLMDALSIQAMVRKYKPKKIVEIGSGFSSALMMEVNDRHFDTKIDMTFIEPYPLLLHTRMKKGDKSRYKVIPTGVQNVPIDVFKQLKKDDILFIDSTHVSKFNSDVNYEIFDILPVLNKGVIIHFHDILDGFEYPMHWLEKGWAWNEQYMLRAFLINNNEYEVLLLTHYLTNHHPDLLRKSYPDDVLNGGSLWLRKV